MKRVLFYILICVLIGSFWGSACADERPTVAVVDFGNDSGRLLPGIGQASAEILSTLLTQNGNCNVVERQKLRSVITEQNFAMSGMVDAEHPIQLGRLLGADYLVTGSVISYADQKKVFNGYGFTSEKWVTRLAVNVKLLDINTGEIRYAGLFSDTSEANGPGIFYGTESFNHDLMVRVLQAAANELVDELNGAGPEAIARVQVSFASEPVGADVEVDGIFVGNTPLALDIIPGLHEVTISYSGYESWHKTIDAYDGMQIKAVLAKKTTETQED